MPTRRRALGVVLAAAAVQASPLAALATTWHQAAESYCEMAPREGDVDTCACSFDAVDAATAEVFGPILRNLTQRRFFRFFKVDLDRECKFWPDDGQCNRPSCAVEICEDAPSNWVEEDRNRSAWKHKETKPAFCSSELQQVDRTAESDLWAESGGDEVWIDQGSDDQMQYVDLLRNPEGYTGYDGEASHRIWRAVYEENCFDLVNTPPPKEQLVLAWRAEEVEKSGQCLERRVFYKLISGLQASISTHIASDAFTFWEVVLSAPAGFRRRWQAFVGAAVSRCYDDVCLAESNDAKFIHAVGMHEDRLQNMYFAYLFVLRAVTRAGPELENYAFGTGDVEDDLETSSLVKRLVSSKADPFAKEADTCEAAQAARAAFDESLLFKAPDRPGMSPLERALARESVEELRSQFVQRFRNVSTIMDCVTCEKCRLWGKLQVLGLGTALKILLMEGDVLGYGVLQRNEVVALVNTLAQLAKSVDSIREWQRRDVRKAHAHFALCVLGVGLVGLGVLFWGARAWRRRKAEGA